MRLVTLLGALASVAAAAVVPATAQERLPAERWTDPYTGGETNIPACDSAGVLGTIRSRFSQTDRTYWGSGLEIVGFSDVRPLGFRTWGLDFVPRLFCTGTVQVSDGHRRRIDFSVIEEGGIIGMTWGVEWCVVGLDRNRAYAPGCQMARP